MKSVNTVFAKVRLMTCAVIIIAVFALFRPVKAYAKSQEPLTPSGNLTLVDDEGSKKQGKQFMTVVTKSGNYFYIIIDRDKDGNQNVHFLNMVDESDLFALMDEEQVNEYVSLTGKGEKEVDKEKTVSNPIPTVVKEKPEPKKKKTNVNAIMSVLFLIGVASAVGYFYSVTMKNKRKDDDGPDPDEDVEDKIYQSTKPDSVELEDVLEDVLDDELEDEIEDMPFDDDSFDEE